MTDKNAPPLVTIAVPVYNEERYIRQTLLSLIAQDYPNIEILICDNKSEDNTGTICAELAKSDSRITYVQNPVNTGAGENHIELFNKARGKYFMWASGHDLRSPNLVSSCVNALEKYSDCNLAYAIPEWVNERGESIERHTGWYDTRGLSPAARFFTVFWGGMNPITGIFRKSAMPDMVLQSNFAGADLVILVELALNGTQVQVTEAKYLRRQFRSIESHNERLHRYRGMLKNRSFTLKLFPLAKLPIALFAAVLNSKISWTEKLLLVFLLFFTIPVRYILARHEKNKPNYHLSKK